MKSLPGLFQLALCGVVLILAGGLTRSTAATPFPASTVINRIEGIVWSPDRRPVSDIYVELLNENYSTITRVRTNASGRFSFTGINAGHYNVKVLTTGTDYLEYTESVDIIQFGGGRANDSAYLDIYLRFDKRKIKSGLGAITGAVFVQDVPEEAQRLYKRGVRDISDAGGRGLDELEQALKIFPTYFDVLNTLGLEYVSRKDYQKSLEYLIRAVTVNQRSFTSFYALAYACYQLNHRPEALEAARASTILQPNSVNAQLLYGTLLRLDGKYPKAEIALLEAKKLSKATPVPEVHWQLALLYNRMGRNKEAADELEAYLAVQPDARDKKGIQYFIAKLRKDTK